MVRAACRRILGERAEVDDAFQAVFLILARKAAAVRHRAFVGPWLHTIAVRTAHKLRAAEAQRLQRERQVLFMEHAQNPACGNEADWLTWLDEELDALPRTFRDPLVLCELEDLSRAEAAERLGIPEGTLSSRLARGKELLRERLRRRGGLVSILALSLVLTQRSQAALDGTLLQNTVQAALGGAVGASVAAVAEGVMHTMLLKEIVSIAIVVAVLALASAGLGLGWHVFAGQVQEAGAGKSDAEKLQGKWEVTTAQMFGKDVEGEEGDRLRMQKLVIEGDKMTMRHGGKFTLNPAKKPKELDFDLQEGPQQEQGVYRGIYELSGDDLTLAMAMPGAERPTEFKTQPGVPHMLLKLKRTK